MATINLVVLGSDATKTLSRILMKGDGDLQCSPYTYVKSTSALGALVVMPLSTAVTVGQKFLYSGVAGHRRRYLECVVAGTTASFQPTGARNDGMNQLVVSSTAQFRIRAHHGWARATQVFSEGNQPNSPTAFTSSNNVGAPAWTVLVASTHTQLCTPSTTYSVAFYCGFPTSGGQQGGWPGHTVVSVNSTPTIPVAFLAGASVLGTGDFAGIVPSTQQNNSGMIRGMTFGHDNTAAVTTQNYDRYNWGVCRYYDCTFSSFRINNPNAGITEDAVHTGARHSVRCTYKSGAAANPAPALSGGNEQSTIVEVPTVTRLVSATTSVVRSSDRQEGGGGGAPFAPGDILIVGWNATSFTGGPIYTYESLRNYNREGGAFRTFGVAMQASAFAPANAASTWIPREQAFSMVGSAAVGNYRGYKRPQLSAWDNVDTVGLAEISMIRNSTFIRTGGCADAIGGFSYACSLTNYLDYPFTLEFWNAKIDESFLVTLEYEWSSTSTGLTALRTEDVWLEAVFLDHPTKQSGALVFSFDKFDRKGLIHNGPTPTAAPTSAVAWGGALGGAVKQKMSVVVSPKQVGPIKLWVGVWQCPWTQNISTTSSVTVYIDPLPILSAAP